MLLYSMVSIFNPKSAQRSTKKNGDLAHMGLNNLAAATAYTEWKDIVDLPNHPNRWQRL